MVCGGRLDLNDGKIVALLNSRTTVALLNDGRALGTRFMHTQEGLTRKSVTMSLTVQVRLRPRQ